MSRNLTEVLKKYVEDVHKIYGEKLRTVILYGSYARGDFRTDSDIDIMILVDLSDDEIRLKGHMLSNLTFDYNFDNDLEIMPIVKNLVQQMGGEITVRSRLGEGSTFTVTLPLTPADAPEEVTAGEERAFGETAAAGKSVSGEAAAAGKLSGEAAAAGKLSGEAAGAGRLSGEERAGAETTPGEHPLAGKRILVAEDNEINMEIAVEFLTMMGAEVMQAKNGQEAVEQFAQSAPGSVDVILMDMQMPVMDGCEASRRIRDMDRPDGRTVIIVAVTANAFAEDVARTREAGMDGHLAKPIDFQALVQLLRTLGESEKGRQPGHPV